MCPIEVSPNVHIGCEHWQPNSRAESDKMVLGTRGESATANKGDIYNLAYDCKKYGNTSLYWFKGRFKSGTFTRKLKNSYSEASAIGLLWWGFSSYSSIFYSSKS